MSNRSQGRETGRKRAFVPTTASEQGEGKKAKQAVTLFLGNLPFASSEDSVREFFKDKVEYIALRLVSDRDTGNFKGYGYMDCADETNAEKALALAGTPFEGRPIKIDYTKVSSGGASGGEKSLTCYVGNLSYDASEEALYTFFEPCGAILAARILCDQQTGQSKGYGYVDFEDQESADVALTYHGSEFMDRKIRVTYDSNNPKSKRNKQRGGDRRGGDRRNYRERY